MASLATATLAQTVDLVALGLEQSIKDELRKRLEALAQEILRDVCVNAAKNVVKQVASYRNIQRDEIVMDIRFNNEQVK